MPLVSLTSDYGTKDHFVGALKGQLYHANKDIIIVDINHEIQPFDVLSGAYILKNASSTFPAGSIHIASINIREGNSRILIIKRQELFYVVPDNGLICLMYPEEDFEAYAVEGLNKNFTFQELHQGLGKNPSSDRQKLRGFRTIRSRQRRVQRIRYEVIVLRYRQ